MDERSCGAERLEHGCYEVTRVLRSKLKDDNRVGGRLLEGPDRWEGLRGGLDIVGAYDQGYRDQMGTDAAGP